MGFSAEEVVVDVYASPESEEGVSAGPLYLWSSSWTSWQRRTSLVCDGSKRKIETESRWANDERGIAYQGPS
jgi:hypothetical protein